MKITFRLLILLLIVSCNKKSDEEFPEYETQEELNNRITEGKPFFDFDEVVHYQIDISKEQLLKVETSEEKTPEQRLFELMYLGIPKNKKVEELFWRNLDSIQKFRKNVKKEFLDELKNKIFTEKECTQDDGEASRISSCAPIYRDIFIFKKEGKNQGIAKICFECNIFNFSYTNAITECFGFNQSGEIKRLKEIISENKKLK